MRESLKVSNISTEKSKEFMFTIKPSWIIICRYKNKNEQIPEEDREMEYLYLNPIDKKITYHKTVTGQYTIQLKLEKHIKLKKTTIEPIQPWVRNKIKEIELKKSGKKKTDKTRKPKESKTTKQPNSYRKFCRNFSK